MHRSLLTTRAHSQHVTRVTPRTNRTTKRRCGLLGYTGPVSKQQYNMIASCEIYPQLRSMSSTARLQAPVLPTHTISGCSELQRFAFGERTCATRFQATVYFAQVRSFGILSSLPLRTDVLSTRLLSTLLSPRPFKYLHLPQYPSLQYLGPLKPSNFSSLGGAHILE